MTPKGRVTLLALALVLIVLAALSHEYDKNSSPVHVEGDVDVGVRGIVVDEQNVPLAGASVYLMDIADPAGQLMLAGQTNNRGEIEVSKAWSWERNYTPLRFRFSRILSDETIFPSIIVTRDEYRPCVVRFRSYPATLAPVALPRFRVAMMHN